MSCHHFGNSLFHVKNLPKCRILILDQFREKKMITTNLRLGST
jgi:hypothetical protein